MTDEEPSSASVLGLLRAEPRFTRWVLAEGTSMVGTEVSTVVLPILVFQLTGSAAQTGLLFALRVVPYLVFGLVAGPVADRGNRRLLIIGGNTIEGLLVATIPVAGLLGVLTVTQVYVVALLSATAFVFSDAAVFGAVPALVGPARLGAANGLLSSLASGAAVLGPVVGGVLVGVVGASNAIALDAASFHVAAAVQVTIRSDFRPEHAEPSAASRLLDQVGRALRFVRDRRAIATLLGVGFGNSLSFGIVIGLLVPYAVQVLGLPDDGGRIGVLYGAIGVGGLLAGAAFSRVFTSARVRWLTPTTLAASAGLAALLAPTATFVPAVALLGLFSLSITTTIIAGITYRQLAAPDDLRSSINVIGRMIAWGGQPFGAAVGAAIVTRTTVSVAYAVAAGVMAASAVAAAILLLPISTGLAADAAER